MLLKYLSALALGVYSINAQAEEYSDMKREDDNTLSTTDFDSEHWRLVVYKTPEQIKGKCECDPNTCPFWTYANGGGFEDLASCGSREDAIAEAQAEFTTLQQEAAQDDIGQILLQIESLLVQREGRSGSQLAQVCQLQGNQENRCTASWVNFAVDTQTYGSQLVGADSGLISNSQCECSCNTETNQVIACNTGEETDKIRRFKNLKAMVMSMQPTNVTVFGRYCYYGCWCLPNGQHNLAAGYGQPVDPIDEVCKEFALCYKCLDMDFAGTCNPEKRSYRWGKIRDSNNDVIDTECKDDPEDSVIHRCKRYTCECDRVLAIGLGQTHWYWNQSHHARWGGFDREASCETDCVGCKPQDDCCGAYGSASTSFTHLTVTRRPYASTSTTSGCCQDVFYYNMLAQECCVEVSGSDTTVTVTDAGTCAGSTIGPDTVAEFDHTFPGYTRK